MRHYTRYVMGIDVSDRTSQVALLDRETRQMLRKSVSTTKKSFEKLMRKHPECRVAFEVGTHSPWMASLFVRGGHEVYVANPSRLASINKNKKKTDVTDAEELCRLADYDPQLLSPIRHRGEEAQAMLALIRSRRVLVESRTKLINHVRGVVKSAGSRLVKCSARGFVKRVSEAVPEQLRAGLAGTFRVLEELDASIKEADEKIESLCSNLRETEILRQIPGVGPLTAATFVLTIEDPYRFARVRQVGSYLGLVPRLDQSGSWDPQLPISRCGDSYLRQLLVQAAHYVLGPFGPDSDLRRWGLEIAARGGKNAKKRAVTAVARKLAVMLLSLWKSGEVYEPLRQAKVASQEQGEPPGCEVVCTPTLATEDA